MKQLSKNTLCYYCLGCNKQENMDFKAIIDVRILQLAQKTGKKN